MRAEELPICVVGSGLAGVSAAKGLEKSGRKVLIIDAGLECPERVKNDVKQLNQVPAWRWTDSDKKRICSQVKSSTTGVKEKLLFNSDFASRKLDTAPVVYQNSKFYASFARGGLSNIWGAGLLPMHSDDIMDWPVALEELEPHYRKILEFVPLAGQHDALEEILPLYGNPVGHGLSRQTQLMLAKMNKNKEKLTQRGIYFGASRLAAQYHGHSDQMDCQYCSMCMYGCPYGILYSSGKTLDELLSDPLYSYKPGFVVRQVKKEGGNVVIYGTDVNGNWVEPVMASRCVLACGAPSTTRITLESLGLIGKSVKMITSDQYYLPMMAWHGQPNIQNEQLHTMCQSYWTIKNVDVSPFLIHGSIFTYNDLYAKAIKSLLGKLYQPLEGLIHIPLQRFFFLISYLHSDHSGYLMASVCNDSKKTLSIQGYKNKDSKDVFMKAKRHLRRNAGLTGLYPFPVYNSEKLPGAGNHFGGSFPMSRNPSGLQTDVLGRIQGLDKVHLADSSVFPSITATTVSLSVMANAHRIATLIATR